MQIAKDCPKCGETASGTSTETGYFMFCTECGLSAPISTDINGAIFYWNDNGWRNKIRGRDNANSDQ